MDEETAERETTLGIARASAKKTSAGGGSRTEAGAIGRAQRRERVCSGMRASFADGESLRESDLTSALHQSSITWQPSSYYASPSRLLCLLCPLSSTPWSSPPALLTAPASPAASLPSPAMAEKDATARLRRAVKGTSVRHCSSV